MTTQVDHFLMGCMGMETSSGVWGSNQNGITTRDVPDVKFAIISDVFFRVPKFGKITR